MTDYNTQVLQQKYEEWCDLYRQQLEAQRQFLRADALQNELKEYYLTPQWMRDRDAGTCIEYSGKAHSIFSEDALWNMLSEHDALARQWLRLGLDAIDKR